MQLNMLFPSSRKTLCKNISDGLNSVLPKVNVLYSRTSLYFTADWSNILLTGIGSWTIFWSTTALNHFPDFNSSLFNIFKHSLHAVLEFLCHFPFCNLLELTYTLLFFLDVTSLFIYIKRFQCWLEKKFL